MKRDLIGYGQHPPAVNWPGSAKVAVNFCVNYEEGAEYALTNGDAHHESYLSDLGTLPVTPGIRHLNIESAYEYGSRAGFWRILEAFTRRGLAFTVNGVGLALEQNPEAARAIADTVCDIQCHGWRWIDYQFMDEAEERAHIANCVTGVEKLTGARPIGWYTGRPSAHTRRLVVEEGGFLYDSDCYNDDLPFWNHDYGRPLLVLPYSLDTNDSAFTRPHGFKLGDEILQYWKDSFARLHWEGEGGEGRPPRPKMMTIGLHGRVIGRPGRISALERFLDYLQGQEGAWICRRGDIARHWADHHPPEI